MTQAALTQAATARQGAQTMNQGGSLRQRLMQFAASTLIAAVLSTGLSSTAEAKYASIVIDTQTGQVLHAAGADTRNFPASLTKMMTLYMTFDALNQGKLTLKQRIPVSQRAAGVSPTRLGLRAGTTVSVEDCILGMAVKSANDCAVAVAEALGGSEAGFARLMTERARKLGMSRTTFKNASGLPNPGQLSTARDMATLGEALIENHARYYPYFAVTSFDFNGTTVNGHNRLMGRYPGMDGLKTGFTNASGFNLTSSAVRDGRRLVGVVFGGQTAGWRDNHMEDLLDRAFNGQGTPMLVADASANRRGKPSRKAEPPAARPTGSDLSLVSSANAASNGTGAQSSAPPSGWGIQVGAFDDRGAGQQAIAQASQRASALLDRAIPHVVEVKRGGAESIYRARLMGLDEKTARRACAQLAKSGQKCLTVPPQTGT